MINELVVSCSSDYVERMFRKPSDEKVEKFFDKNPDQIDAIGEIIGIEVACYIMRRTAGFCQSNNDTLWALRRKLIKQYERTFGVWKDHNKDVDF